MAEPLADQIMEKIKQTAELYHRLILVVAPTSAGKSSALKDVKQRTGAPLVNVNLELSCRLLDLTERQRTLQLPRLLQEIVAESESEMILLDNIEVLFDAGLKQDPLRLLQLISRNKTVAAAWNGAIVDEYLTYAAPDHPEYRRYPLHDFLTASPEATA